MSGDNQAVLENFEGFVFKEVLGGDVARKAIFILLYHPTEDKSGILICDKDPFAEEREEISEWVHGMKLRHLTSNDIYSNYEALLPEKFNTIKSTLIYPATLKHILKYRCQEVYLIQETAEDYKNITSIFINDGNFDLKWVYNFINKEAETERILLSDDDPNVGFMLGMDLKWNGKNVENLYLQTIVKRRDIRSIRELTGDHLSLLENIREKVSNFVMKKYGLHRNQILMYFHYQPTYYHLHIHVINIKYDAPGHGPTSTFLDTVINNLKMDGEFYKKATLPFFCKQFHPLYDMFKNAGRL